MLDDFLWRAALGGFGVALAAGPLGCFVVWRRMAYFGDATAHAAILGVALALAFSFSVEAGVLAIALAVALIVAGLSDRGFGADTALGVVAHAGLALGLTSLVSYIDPANARSIKLAEKLGARLDPAAKGPSQGDLVYRHPLPEAA